MPTNEFKVLLQLLTKRSNWLLQFVLILNLIATILAKPPYFDKVTSQQDIKQNYDGTKTPWSIEEILTMPREIKSFNGTWFKDNSFYYLRSDRSIIEFNAETKQSKLLVSAEDLKSYNNTSTVKFSPDGSQLLIGYEAVEVFRHSTVAKYNIFNLNTKTSTPIQKGLKLQYCAWSPDKERLSYVYNNNVYVHWDDNNEQQLTLDGINGEIYNGVPDWVYEEEVFGTNNALWWSPEATHLAVGFFNDVQVSTYKYAIYEKDFHSQQHQQYPIDINLKYPKPGTNNPLVSLKVFRLTTSTTPAKSVEIKAPQELVSDDHILQTVAWASDSDLVVVWLNRRQNIASMQMCSIEETAICKEVKGFKEPNGWISISNLLCMKNSLNCYFRYWIDNWYQAWNLDLRNSTNLWPSRGNFTVLQIYGYDEKAQRLYYQATSSYDVSVYHVYSNDVCLSCKLNDDSNDVCRLAKATFSLDYKYYTLTCDGPNPRYTNFYRADSMTLIQSWENNSAFAQKLSHKLRPEIRYMNVTLANNAMGIAKVYLPPNLDPTKKYPMIVNVYGGPGSVRVTSSFNVDIEYNLITEHNIIYVQIDGRGTGNKGKETLFSVNNHLGEFEVDDQFFVTKTIQKEFEYVDPQRIGIWGWSYGGYMTARTLARDSKQVFRCGISVAPVSSWLFYDTIYTERYMGLPIKTDNLKKYNETSVLDNFRQLENFRTHKFLLVHGTGDDNVHYQHSLLFAKLLQKMDIQFDEMTYTDENHAIGNLRLHLYHTIEHFWLDCFNLL